jgi:ABC-2 type transport system ATP-binding protein
MSEMQLIAQHLVVIGRGRLIADCAVDDFVRRGTGVAVRVRSPQADQLAQALAGQQVNVTRDGDVLEVAGLPIETIGEIAAGSNVVLHELTQVSASLEDAFMRLTADAVEYHGAEQQR